MIQVGGDLPRTFVTAEVEKNWCLFRKMCFNTMNLYINGKINNIKEWEEIVEKNSNKINEQTNKNIQQEKLRLINERIKKYNKSIYDSKGRLLI